MTTPNGPKQDGQMSKYFFLKFKLRIDLFHCDWAKNERVRERNYSMFYFVCYYIMYEVKESIPYRSLFMQMSKWRDGVAKASGKQQAKCREPESESEALEASECDDMEFKIPQCYVVVRKLTLAEISRINVNPFLVKHRCGRCNQVLQYGPKCQSCKTLYHLDCAMMSQKCCAKFILPPSQQLTLKSQCAKCNGNVQFGPQCSLCENMFHNYCVSAFDRCCSMPIFMRNIQEKCASCHNFVDLGPRCPLCCKTYHFGCLKNYMFGCCKVRIDAEKKKSSYHCSKCNKRVRIASPICAYCGTPSHVNCLQYNGRKCCGKIIDFDVFLIPSFTYLNKMNRLNGNDNLLAIKNEPFKEEVPEIVTTQTRKRSYPTKPKRKYTKRAKIVENPVANQAPNPFNNLKIIDIKSEPQEIESLSASPDHNIEIDHDDYYEEETAPILAREEPIQDPVPSTSSATLPQLPELSIEDDDTLESLFYFLYKVVKKFPPILQNQVKFQLFKTVNEAEMKLSNGRT